MTTPDVGESTRAGRLAPRLLDGGNYLAVFIMGVPLSILGNDVYPGVPIVKGQAWAVLAPLLCAFAAGLLWLTYRSTTRYSRLVTAFLVMLAVSWLVIWVLERRDGQTHSYATFLVPLLIAMLLIKPIDRQSVQVAADVFAWTIVAVVIIAEAHALLTGYRGADPAVAIRIPGLSQVTTAGERWEGPFGSPNYAGPDAAFLVIYALSRRGFTRWFMVSFGAIMLLLSGSRSAFMGLAAALAVLFVFAPSSAHVRLSRPARAILSMVVLAAIAVVAVRVDPTLNGRTPIWPQYWSFWRSSPLTGVGTTSIQHAIETGTLGPWFVHAHDLVLDVLGRYGLTGFMAVISMLTLAAITTLRPAGKGRPLGLALVVSFLTIGLVEVQGSWVYWGLPSMWVVLAVLDSVNPRTSRLEPDPVIRTVSVG